MTVLKSYDLNGKKLSFANWISNLSPQETPFTSMTGKESIQQTLFQWQTDHLAKAGKNAVKEGEEAVDGQLYHTTVKSNITQILRKVVKVSDTANALANYGRGKELQYQMEKAGKEIKRDLEWAFLHNKESVEEKTTGGQTTGRKTAGFTGLVSPKDVPDPDTGAMVHKNTKETGKLSEADIFGLTYELYVAGSKANVIMYHPKWATEFSALQEKGVGAGTRERIFENTPKFSVYVATLIDPLGQEYKLVPNRWMPEGQIFFFNASDWTQMVLRAPQRTKLAKDGSYEKWMIEMEVGLRHRNPYASGILDVDHSDDTKTGTSYWETAKFIYTNSAGAANTEADIGADKALHIEVKAGTKIDFKYKTQATLPKAADGAVAADNYTPVATDVMRLFKDGSEFGHWTGAGSTEATKLVTAHAGPIHSGTYYAYYMTSDGHVKCGTMPVTVRVV